MFTLLIVDDEPLSRVGVASMLDWRSLDVSIVGTSPNGLHAFQAIKDLKPDIVIADVRMPLLDGLSLIERCRAELDGGPEFIVLSGYADFDAARRSLRSSAVDYLVKLELDEAALRASVERAKTAVLGKRKSGLAPGGGAGKADPFAETALTRLLTGYYEESAEARAALERSGIEAGPLSLLVAYFTVSYASSGDLSEDERLRAYCCAVDMVKQLLGRRASVLVVPFDAFSFAALLAFPRPDSAAIGADDSAIGSAIGGANGGAEGAAAAVEDARDLTEKYFGVELRVGLGSARAEPERIPDSYREAMRAAEATSEKEPVLAYDAIREKQDAGDKTDLAARRAAFARAVAERSSEGLRSAAAEAIAELGSVSGSAAPASEVLAACCELAYALLERLEDGEQVLDSFFPEEPEGWRFIFTSHSAARARSWLETAVEGLCARFASAEFKGRNPLVAGVRKYVNENFAEKLTLADVARRFRVSPNHLSSIFKKYGGVGFAEYVAQVKVEKAKALIREGRYKMFEVAQLLGFEDAFYFSKVFKKVAGISPRDFYLSCGPIGRASDGKP
ncbi:MAG: response regulator [Spirochaetaceae bacterium]|nr:response regulator [Spirochaetaceae bacterium]